MSGGTYTNSGVTVTSGYKITEGANSVFAINNGSADIFTVTNDTGTNNATVFANKINGTTLQYGGVDINTNTALSNVAYLNKANTFSQGQQIQGNLQITNSGTLSVAGSSSLNGISNNNGGISGAGNISGAISISGQSISLASGSAEILSSLNPTITIATAGNDGTLTWQDADSHTLMYIQDMGTAGDLHPSGNVDIPTGKEYRINGVSLNTNTALSNVAYLNKTNTFTVGQTINAAAGLTIGSSGTLSVAGASLSTELTIPADTALQMRGQ